jgi:hypothetical protein
MTKTMIEFDEIVSQKEAAGILQCSVPTLSRWRVEGKGPRFLKMGASGTRARVRYRVSDLKEFLIDSLNDPNG